MFYSLIGSLGPNLHFNDGMRDVVRLKLAPRTITNAEPPAPVSNYQMVNLKLVDVILEALAQLPSRARDRQCRLIERAHHRLDQGPARPVHHAIRDHGLGLWRRHGPRRRLRDRDPSEQPAHHADRDSRIRVSLPHHALRAGAGLGRPGRWRGGPEPARANTSSWKSATVIRRYDKSRFPPGGIAGGKPGRGARFVIRLGTAQEYATPPSGRYDMQAGERFLLQSAGGGGYGDPRHRDPAALARDLAEGYVSAEAAKKDYGG